MEHLQLVLNWFNILGINPNLDKLKRQLSIITTWFNNNCIGVLEAVTGFGKTYVAIIAIYRLNLKYEEANTIVIVPTIKLRKDWEEHVNFFGLKNVEVFVVNTYTSNYLKTKVRPKCVLLIADEVHNYLGENAIQFNWTIRCTDFKMFLGLSATLEDKEKEILQNLVIPIIDTITMSEALRNNYVSAHKVYNYGIELEPQELDNYIKINDIHNSNYSKFYYFVEGDKNWELAMACAVGNDINAKIGDDWKTGRSWREWYAKTMDWDGNKEHPWSPANIAKYANQWNWAMRERKDFLHKHHSKIKAAKEIIDHLQVQTITFSENTSFADELKAMLGDKAMTYHSNIVTGFTIQPTIAYRKSLTSARKVAREYSGTIVPNNEELGYEIHYNKEVKISAAALKRLAISKFESGEINVLVTAKALDEGFNVENAQCGIICSGSSKKRQYTQRKGRPIRFVEGKIAYIINLYIKGTQDETWLKRKQKGDPGILWITKPTEII